jgi:hypothetical protein
MATGANIQPGRGREVTNLPPQVDVRSNAAQVYGEAARTFDRFYDAAKPDLIRRAQARGGEEGAAIAAGEQEYRRDIFTFGDVAAARAQAREAAFIARTRTDIEARDDQLRNEYRYDPEGYARASQEAISTFIQNAPAEWAVNVETFARTRQQASLASIAQARVARDDQETVQALAVREAKLTESLVALAANGVTSGEQYDALMAERDEVQTTRASNPAVLYSEDQRVADDEKLFDDLTTALVVRSAVQQYRANGRGGPGLAAASRYLEDNVLEGEAFADMDPGRRSRVHREARRQLSDFAVADREEERAREAAEAEARAEARERAGEYRLRILLGEATEADILADETLDDGVQAGLVASARANARRLEREARSDAAAGRSDAMQELMAQAGAGTLSTGEIADSVAAGLINQQQARTLRSYNDQSLRPIIEDVMAPVRDVTSRGGMNRRPDYNANLAVAEEAAARFVRDNPDLTLEQRLAGGRAIAERVFGAAGAGRPGGAQTANTEQAARVRAANQRIQAARDAGRPFSPEEEARIRREARNAD